MFGLGGRVVSARRAVCWAWPPAPSLRGPPAARDVVSDASPVATGAAGLRQGRDERRPVCRATATAEAERR